MVTQKDMAVIHDRLDKQDLRVEKQEDRLAAQERCTSRLQETLDQLRGELQAIAK